jgi:hypothetical protein
MKVPCSIGYVELEGDWGDVPGVEVACSRCGHSQTAYGQHTGSVKRCLVQLNKTCPKDESNFYEAGE